MITKIKCRRCQSAKKDKKHCILHVKLLDVPYCGRCLKSEIRILFAKCNGFCTSSSILNGFHEKTFTRRVCDSYFTLTDVSFLE